MTTYRDFDTPDAFTTAALGRPGQRVFLIQVRGEGEVITLKCEKQQVAAIAHFVRELLEDLPVDDMPLPDSLDILPVNGSDEGAFDFTVGPIGVAYDRELDRVVIQLDEMVPLDENDEPDRDIVAGRVRGLITRGQALAFCDHADDVVSAGRPNCRWCGYPIDPDGHPCPRMN
ncbi:MAG: hypothetical protein RJB08_1193 [Actinomycetota bacterium]|jgi:uncharacterized repeat protein (TIGR03847 family)